MHLSFLRRPSVVTHTKEAIVTIGNGCILSGTRISCVDSVKIGEESLLGSLTIIDSEIIPTRDMSIDAEWRARHVQSIEIGTHVWCGTNSFVLGGSNIGDECVLGTGAVLQNRDVPERSILIGNPARKVGVIKSE